MVPTVHMDNGKAYIKANALILVITHNCNLRCWYCPTLRNSEAINFKTAKQSIEIFLNSNKNNDLLIRFFGGEPLLEFDLVKKIFNFTKKKYPERKIRFNLTTNGLLLTEKKISFFRRNPEFELIINSETSKFPIRQISPLVSLPNSMLNLLITPKKVNSFSNRYFNFINLGFKRFNFLPAYFVRWKEMELDKLKNEFNKLSGIVKNQLKDRNFYLKNLHVRARTPLFNSAFIVDCNGDIFSNNLFLAKFFNNLREELKISNISHTKSILDIERFNREIDFNKIYRESIPADILKSTFRANKILSDFIFSLRQ